MTRRPVGALAVALAAGLLAACGSSASSPAIPTSVVTLAVAPANSGPVANPGGGSTTAQTCNGGQPTASLAPTGPLPPPDQMPAGSDMATIEKRGYLIGGVDQNTLLWAYRDPVSGQLDGFDIDMIRQVSDAIFGDSSPAHLHFVVVPNADRISAVQSGEVDIVAETMTITCAREQLVDFSTEYYDAGQRVLVPNGSAITSAAALAGHKVCAAAGSTSLANLASLPHPPVLYAVANQTDCLVMVQQGQVDAISTDDTILEGLAAQDPNLTLLPGVRLSDEPYGMAISQQHPDFTRFVNAVLAKERADGMWRSIWQRWLGAVVKTAPPEPPPAVYRS